MTRQRHKKLESRASIQGTFESWLKKYRYTLGLLFIFILVSASNIYVAHQNRSPYTAEQIHFRRSLVMEKARQEGRLLEEVFSRNNAYPPLLAFVNVMVYSLLGVSELNALLSLLPFLALYLWACFDIGRSLKSAEIGFFAALFSAMLPGVFGFSRALYLEFPLTALTLLSVAILLRSEGLTNRRYLAAFSITIALGLLTKHSFSLYLAGPLLWYLWRLLRVTPSPRERLVAAGKLCSAVLFGALLAAPWYILAGGSNISQIVFGTQLGSVRSSGFFIMLVRYMAPLRFLCTPTMGALAIVGLLLLGARRDWNPLRFLALYFLPAFLALSLFIVTQTSPRFIVPLVPAAGFAIAFGFCGLKDKLIRRSALLALSLVAVGQFIAIPLVPGIFGYRNDQRLMYGLLFPDNAPWDMDSIYGELGSLVEFEGGGMLVMHVKEIGGNSIAIQQLKGVIPSSLEILDVEGCSAGTYCMGDTGDFSQMVTENMAEEAKWFMIGVPIEYPGLYAPEVTRALLDIFNEQMEMAEWVLIKEVYRPGGTIQLYERSKPKGQESHLR